MKAVQEWIEALPDDDEIERLNSSEELVVDAGSTMEDDEICAAQAEFMERRFKAIQSGDSAWRANSSMNMANFFERLHKDSSPQEGYLKAVAKNDDFAVAIYRDLVETAEDAK